MNEVRTSSRKTRVGKVPGRDNYSLPANSILCLYNDRNNNMWAGSIRNGLISIREVSMKTYKDVLPGNDRGLSNSTVLSLFQEYENRIWIGTDGGGINSFNPFTEKFAHYPSTWEDTPDGGSTHRPKDGDFIWDLSFNFGPTDFPDGSTGSSTFLQCRSFFGVLRIFNAVEDETLRCTVSGQEAFLQQVYDIISAEP